jgi:uncharacterized protein YllA (UPF0747 family)
MTVQHADGSTCMADFWEQSAKLLQQRIEKLERDAKDAWDTSAELNAEAAAVSRQMLEDIATRGRMKRRIEELEHLIEEYERIIESLWPLIPPQEPSPALRERIVALIGGMTNTAAVVENVKE